MNKKVGVSLRVKPHKLGGLLLDTSIGCTICGRKREDMNGAGDCNAKNAQGTLTKVVPNAALYMPVCFGAYRVPCCGLDMRLSIIGACDSGSKKKLVRIWYKFSADKQTNPSSCASDLGDPSPTTGAHATEKECKPSLIQRRRRDASCSCRRRAGSTGTTWRCEKNKIVFVAPQTEQVDAAATKKATEPGAAATKKATEPEAAATKKATEPQQRKPQSRKQQQQRKPQSRE